MMQTEVVKAPNQAQIYCCVASCCCNPWLYGHDQVTAAPRGTHPPVPYPSTLGIPQGVPRVLDRRGTTHWLSHIYVLCLSLLHGATQCVLCCVLFLSGVQNSHPKPALPLLFLCSRVPVSLDTPSACCLTPALFSPRPVVTTETFPFWRTHISPCKWPSCCIAFL